MNPVAFRILVAAMVPVLIAISYFGFIASDRYVSESGVVLRSGNQSVSNLSLGGLLPLSNPDTQDVFCLLYTSPSPRDATLSRMPSSA